MDLLKSVFADSSSPSPPSTTSSQNSQINPPPTSWPFGSTLFRTIATKSESLLDNYYKDIQEFSSGLKKETSVIRQVASRAVQDLPARLESGAAIAQVSLEAVGQAIDNVGLKVSEIIGKDLNFVSDDSSFNNHSDEIGDNYDKDLNTCENAKPYSRIHAMIRGLQCNIRVYCEEVEESDYDEWKIGFRIEERREEIGKLFEENGVIKEIFDEVVPRTIDEETFWCRYFYKVDKLVKAEESRLRIVKRAIMTHEEDLSWDLDDDDHISKNEVEDSGKSMDNICFEDREKGIERGDEGEASGSGSKEDTPLYEDNLEEGLKFDEKSGSEGKIESDFSVISSQRSSHDFGWDEIEDVRSEYESKVPEPGTSKPSGKADIHRRLESSEEDEELSWNIEDDDQ